jgi:hypothetical protein
MEDEMSDWETLGAVDPRLLTDARLQMHWAAQAASAVGKLLGEPLSDSSQQSFQWVEDVRCLAQAPIAGRTSFRSALRFDTPALAFLDESGKSLHEFSLHGRTLDEAYHWVRERAEELYGAALPGELERGAGLPAHPVAEGALFETSAVAPFAELGRYFGGANRILEGIAARRQEASLVRCWPHHFDIATLVEVDAAGEAETARSLGLGLSPGDGSYGEPYFYVTPWPYPENPELPPLPAGGLWHREGWLGAVLLAESLVGTSSNGSQRRRIQEFLDAALEACRLLLQRGPGS